ncbi:MAG: DUF58 domain-containing protein [Planctomycetota bacterium]
MNPAASAAWPAGVTAGAHDTAPRNRRGKRRLRPGRASGLYVVALGSAVFAASYTQANLLFWGVGLLLGAMVVSVAYAAFAMRRLTIRRTPPGFAVVGEPLALRYRLGNRSRWPVLALTIEEALRPDQTSRREIAARNRRVKGRPIGWSLHLGAGEQAVAETVCWPLRRGRLRLQAVELRSAFPFGLIDCRVRFDRPTEVTVLPQLYRLRRRAAQRALGVTLGQSQARAPTPGDGVDLYELRDYRPGDAPGAIDWKRSAKTGKLISRRFAQPEPPQTWIGLDLSRPGSHPGSHDYSTSSQDTAAEEDRRAQERAVSLAASLVCEAFLAGMAVGLTVAGAPRATIAPRGGLEQRRRLLQALAHLDAEALRNGGPLAGRPTVFVTAQSATDGDRRARGARTLSYADLPDLAVEVDARELLAPLDAARRAPRADPAPSTPGGART